MMGKADDLDKNWPVFQSTPMGKSEFRQEWVIATGVRKYCDHVIRGRVWTRKRLAAKANALLRRARR